MFFSETTRDRPENGNCGSTVGAYAMKESDLSFLLLIWKTCKRLLPADVKGQLFNFLLYFDVSQPLPTSKSSSGNDFESF